MDHEGLAAQAERHDACVVSRLRPGHYVHESMELARARTYAGVLAEDDWRDLEGAVREAFVLGQERTPHQDLEYALNQLVEVALRALSPGVNDPFTAIVCIDRLGSALADMAARERTRDRRRDGSGVLRLVTKPVHFPGALAAAFDMVRQNAGDQPGVVIRLMETLRIVRAAARRPEDAQAVERQMDMVEALAEARFLAPEDLRDLRAARKGGRET